MNHLKKIAIKKLIENEIIKDKLKKELDQKVIERTEELNRANEILKEQADKINQINSKIDLENYVLKKNISEIIKARVTHESVKFEEFNKIYQDENACYEYLSDLKWKHGFSCRKCNGKAFSEGIEPYSKRCTSCNYTESVTSNTLFHKLKFPIINAFYILFIVTNNSQITIDEIALTLNMRRNTCWSFKNKIKSNIKNSKSKDLKNWNLIILHKSES